MEVATEKGLVLYRVNQGHSTSVDDVAAALKGQTSSDWSAVYAQYTVEHAERYLPNRWNDMACTTAELIELRAVTSSALRTISLLDDWMRDSTLPSAEKAALARHAVNERFGIVFDADGTSKEPLMQGLGRRNCLLHTWDTDDDLECVIPHNLLYLHKSESDCASNVIGAFEYRILARYYRHPQYPVTLRKEDLS